MDEISSDVNKKNNDLANSSQTSYLMQTETSKKKSVLDKTEDFGEIGIQNIGEKKMNSDELQRLISRN